MDRHHGNNALNAKVTNDTHGRGLGGRPAGNAFHDFGITTAGQEYCSTTGGIELNLEHLKVPQDVQKTFSMFFENQGLKGIIEWIMMN